MNAFALLIVLAIGNGTSSSQHPLTSMSVVFSSKERCEAALENVRMKTNKAYVVLLSCERT